MPGNTADIRKEYSQKNLLESSIAKDPLQQFGLWWKDALDAEIDDVNAMTLATASMEAVPSARIVLLKEFNQDGFVFFTNYIPPDRIGLTGVIVSEMLAAFVNFNSSFRKQPVS